MPIRTRVDSSFSAKKVLSASARAGTSATSPSRRTPGRRGATAPRLSDSDPLAVTSAAAMWPGSRSRPTIAAWEEERFLNTVVLSAVGRRGLTTERARRPASRIRLGETCLPGEAGGAATLGVRTRAGTRDDARSGLHDAEVVAGRRRDVERVVVGTRGDDERGAGAGGQRLLDVLEVGLRRVVVLVVRVPGLHGGLSLTDGRLALGVLGAGALAEEGGESDRGEDADDQDDDQELDKGEALLALGALAELVQHVGGPS